MLFGHEAWQARKYMDLSYPIDNGIIKNWDDTKLLWDYGFKKLGVNPKNTSILVTESVRNSNENREKLANIIFEKFGFSTMQIQVQAILSMYSEGRMTSCILDSGDGVSNIIPIVDGYVINNRIKKSELAGKEVTKYLTKLLFLRGYAFNTSADFETVKEIKEKLCFVSADIGLDRKLANETVFFEQDYVLPDGNLVKVRDAHPARQGALRGRRNTLRAVHGRVLHQRTRRACLRFHPRSRHRGPRHPLQEHSFVRRNHDAPGLPRPPQERHRGQLENLRQPKPDERKNRSGEHHCSARLTQAPPRRHINVFSGATVFAQTARKKGPLSETMITKKEYDETGSSIVKRKAWSLTSVQ